MALTELFVRLKWPNSYVYYFLFGLFYVYGCSRLKLLPDFFLRLLLNIELLFRELDMNGSLERPECFICELDEIPDKIENFLFSGSVL